MVARIRRIGAFSAALTAFFAASSCWAQTPQPWQMGMQASHSPVMKRIASLNTEVTVIIVVITIFVAALLGWVVFRYNAKRNPVPGKFSHNTMLEVAWTTLPALILAAIVIKSFQLVYFEDRTHNADVTVKVTGHQWFWEYTYPDAGGLDFSSYMVPDDQLQPGQLRHLAVDNQLVVPAGKNIRILTTSMDVIHSFFIPSLGVQRYAIPGRTIETWFRVDQPGDYYGECNQICGTNHSVMPISVHALSEDDYKAWLVSAKTKFSSAAPTDNTRLASAQTPEH